MCWPFQTFDVDSKFRGTLPDLLSGISYTFSQNISNTFTIGNLLYHHRQDFRVSPTQIKPL